MTVDATATEDRHVPMIVVRADRARTIVALARAALAAPRREALVPTTAVPVHAALAAPRQAARVLMTVALARVAPVDRRPEAREPMIVVLARMALVDLRRVVLAYRIVGHNRPVPVVRISIGQAGPRLTAAGTVPRLAITAAWNSGSIASSRNSSNCEANCAGDNS